MPNRKVSDTENKLLILHAVNRLGAVTEQQLLTFMVENEFMDYIALRLGLSELMEGGLLREISHDLGLLYALTGKGHDALHMFQTRVPHSRLTMLDELADEWRVRFRREKQMLADFEKLPDGSFQVRLRLQEQGEDLLDLKLNVPTHTQAQKFADAWIAKAGYVYSAVLKALSGE